MYVGTIKRKQKKLPTALVSVQKRNQYSNCFAFQQNLMLYLINLRG